jgi:hypothetical protein
MLSYQLGCGTYRVFVQERCASAYVAELKGASSITYGRRLNEISEAEVVVNTGCCDVLATVNPWQHELAIYRNDQQVWVGPIIDIDFSPADDSITVFAKDLLEWSNHRTVELADIDYDADETDMADAFIWLLNHGYCKDPWCMSWSIDPINIPVQGRFYPAFDKTGGERWGGGYVIIGDEMRALSEAGVDFTVVNRHLWGGDVQVINPVGSGIILLDQHFRTSPPIKVTGSKQANRFVSGGGAGGYYGFYDDQLYIYPPISGPIKPDMLTPEQQQYGLLEVFNTTDIYDEVDTTTSPNPIAQDARSRWDLLSAPYVYVPEGTLDPTAPLDFNQDLIPGAIMSTMLTTTCRPLTQTDARLKEVNVTVSADDEEINIVLTPLGTSTLTNFL